MAARGTCLAGAALVLAGCGRPAQIDARKAEHELAAAYEQQVDGAEVSAVRCPSTIDNAIGTTAVCRMRLSDGTTGRITVRVIDEDGHLRWDVVEPRH